MFDLTRASIATLLLLTPLSSSRASAHTQSADDSGSRIAMNTEWEAEAFPQIYTTVSGGELELLGGPEYYDEFPSTTSVTQVVVTIYPPAVGSIDVVTLLGPTWYENTSGAWQATFPMPSPGIQKKGEFEVYLESAGDGDDDDPNGGVIIIGREGP